ncbi:hypothetical protein [Tranquillimonas rosea]|uniref:hypothetical protein n=1 Tax=Tranquillimonas rosea TaxID=641238 RepID=UPI003BA9951E
MTIRTWPEQKAMEKDGTATRATWLRQVRDSGMYLAEAAEALSIDHATLHRMMKRCGLQMDLPADRRFMQLHKLGLTASEIAERTGARDDSVRQWARRRGITLKSGRTAEARQQAAERRRQKAEAEQAAAAPVPVKVDPADALPPHLKRQIDQLTKEGWTRPQAIRAIAAKAGVLEAHTHTNEEITHA